MNKIYANGNYFFVQLDGDSTPSSDAKGNVVVNLNSNPSELLLSSALTVNTIAGDFGLFTISTIQLDGDFSSLINANVTTFKFTYLNAGLVPQEWTGKASIVSYVPIDDKTYITPIFSGFTPVSANGSNMVANQKLYNYDLSYQIASPKIGLLNLPLSTLADVNGNAYTQATWEAFYLANSGFNPASGGSGAGVMTKSVYDTNDDGIVDTADKEMIQVINKTGSTITKGSIVYLKSTSSSGTHPEILLASASTEATSSKTIGAVYEDILNDGLGYVVTSGEVRNAVTNAYAIGTKLWLSNTPGLVQTTPPTQPLHSVFIGTVTRSQANNGRILYAIQNGYELDELHDVDSSSKGNNTVLGFVTSTGLNVYKTIAQWLGFTPISTSIIGAPNGIVPLNSSTKIDQTYLPSYVDDVLEFDNITLFPTIGESGKIYIALNTNLTYRWSGTVYVEISPSLALGETSSTAYRGDRGKTAYDHSQLTGNPHGTTKSDIGLSNVDNTSDVNKPVSTAQQTELDKKSNKLLGRSRKTSSHVATLSDVDTLIEMNVPTANTFTLNTGIFQDGHQIVIEQYGAGETTITAGSGMTINSNGSKFKTNGQFASCTIIFKSGTEASIYGNLKV